MDYNKYSWPITLRATIPDNQGLLEMVEYTVELRPQPDYWYEPPGTFNGLHVKYADWTDHYMTYCGKKGVMQYFIQIVNTPLNECIKIFMHLDGFADMTLDQYVDSILGPDFREKFELTVVERLFHRNVNFIRS